MDALKGFNDMLPAGVEAHLDARTWATLLATAERVLAGCGYHQVWLPVAEATELFARGIGEGTDIVHKEMYSFTDRGGRAMTLRPEGTAGAVRAYLQRRLPHDAPEQRWWYFGPMFRAERPQRGRYRQFYQLGAELVGAASPLAEAEMLAMLGRLLRGLGIAGAVLHLNSLGDAATRATYLGRLVPFLAQVAAALCPSCQARLERSPLRVMDCKSAGCRAATAGAPRLVDALSAEARQDFAELTLGLEALGVAYTHDHRLVRGLDYYTGLIFEFVAAKGGDGDGGGLGAQDTLIGGGRYDGLIGQLGGPSTTALGFAAGVERLALAMQPGANAGAGGCDLYLIGLDPPARRALLALAEGLRAARAERRVVLDAAGGRVGQQLRRADRAGARFALVVGERELASGTAQLKALAGGGPVAVSLTVAGLEAAMDAPHPAR